MDGNKTITICIKDAGPQFQQREIETEIKFNKSFNRFWHNIFTFAAKHALEKNFTGLPVVMLSICQGAKN